VGGSGPDRGREGGWAERGPRVETGEEEEDGEREGKREPLGDFEGAVSVGRETATKEEEREAESVSSASSSPAPAELVFLVRDTLFSVRTGLEELTEPSLYIHVERLRSS